MRFNNNIPIDFNEDGSQPTSFSISATHFFTLLISDTYCHLLQIVPDYLREVDSVTFLVDTYGLLRAESERAKYRKLPP